VTNPKNHGVIATCIPAKIMYFYVAANSGAISSVGGPPAQCQEARSDSGTMQKAQKAL